MGPVASPQEEHSDQGIEWDINATGRERRFECFEAALGAVSERLIELADIQSGHKVLDVGTGFGEPALAAARRAGADGRVVGTDISPNGIDIAKRLALDAAVNNIEFRLMDAERLDFPDDSFDAVLCRMVLMFVPNLSRALSEIHRTLVPGGRLAAAVLGPAGKTPLVWIWERALGTDPRREDPDGPFCLAERGVLAKKVAQAGFTDVRTEAVDVEFRFSSFEDFLGYLQDTREDVNQVLQVADQLTRAQVVERMKQAIRPFEDPDGSLRLASETNLVSASAASA